MYRHKDTILHALATKGAVNKATIVFPCKSKRAVYQAIRELKEEKLIREVSERMALEGASSKTVDYLTITESGLRSLVKRDKVIPWARYLEVGSLKIVGSVKKREIVNRYLRISSTAFFMEKAGAREILISLQNLDDASSKGDPEKDNYLSKIVDRAIRAWKEESPDAVFYPEEEKAEPDLQFIDSLSIKRIMHKQIGEIAFDVRSSIATGIAHSPKRNAILYFADEVSPLKWTSHTKGQGYTLLQWAIAYVFEEHPKDDAAWILLVTSPCVFKASYAKSQIKDKSKKYIDSILGQGPNDYFFVCPVEPAGTHEMRSLMFRDLKKEERQIIDMLIKSGRFCENKTAVSPGSFPLVDSENANSIFALGIHMRPFRIYGIERLAEEQVGSYTITVLCAAWQVPYYEQILKYARIMPLDQDLLDQAGQAADEEMDAEDDFEEPENAPAEEPVPELLPPGYDIEFEDDDDRLLFEKYLNM